MTHDKKCLTIGLTGQSGAGKGAASAVFAKHGIPTVDTDAVYHDILRQKGPCTDELVAAFGTDILDDNGLVARKKLAQRVFGHADTAKRLHTLNEVTHKYIMAKTREYVLEHKKSGAPAVLIDAPQLFEAGVERECDLVLGIVADRDVCLSRITGRDGISREAAERRLDAQHDTAYFRAHCDAVIENNGDLAALEREIRRFLAARESNT